MWPYATRSSRFMGDVSAISPSALKNEHFGSNDVSVKLWLPEKLVTAIDVLCDQHDASRPDVLRWIFFEHAFGRVEFAHLQRRYDVWQEERARSGVVASVTRRSVEDLPTLTPRQINASLLGKATEDLKLFLPGRLKRELQDLAKRSGQPLSDYLRGALARQLLGERFFQDWQEALAEANAEAGRHEFEIVFPDKR